MNLDNLKTTSLLTTESLKRFLDTEDLKTLADQTEVPYDTLKNYRSGRTPLENIPYRILKPLSDNALRLKSPFIGVNHVLVDESDWDSMIKQHRPHGYNALMEFYLPYFYYYLYTKNDYALNPKTYFLLDLEALNQAESIPDNFIRNLETFAAIGLGVKFSYIIKGTDKPLKENLQYLLNIMQPKPLKSNKIYPIGTGQTRDGNVDKFKELKIVKPALPIEELKKSTNTKPTGRLSIVTNQPFNSKLLLNLLYLSQELEEKQTVNLPNGKSYQTSPHQLELSILHSLSEVLTDKDAEIVIWGSLDEALQTMEIYLNGFSPMETLYGLFTKTIQFIRNNPYFQTNIDFEKEGYFKKIEQQKQEKNPKSHDQTGLFLKSTDMTQELEELAK